MLRVPDLTLPDMLPDPEAIRSWGQNRHSYEPEGWELEYACYRYLGRVSDDHLGHREEEAAPTLEDSLDHAVDGDLLVVALALSDAVI
jgi:hypothetical protein